MRGRYPPLDALFFFLVASRTRSFTQAAELLFVTRSAVSRRIKNLESYLGVKLFYRHNTKLEMTTAGLRYANELSRIFADLKTASDNLIDSAGQELQLVLNLSATFNATWLIRRLVKLEKMHPELNLIFQTNDVDAGGESVDFDVNRMDAAILLGRGDWKDRNFDKLFDVHIQPVCAPHFLENGKPMSLEQFVKHNWLHYKHLPDLWQQWLTELGAPELQTTRKNIVLDNVAVATQAAIDGLGIIPMYRPLADPLLEEGKLVLAHEQAMKKSESYYFICPKNYEDLPAVKLFRHWVLKESDAFREK